MKHVVIYGPGGCGKTRNKDALAKAFGCGVIYDGISLHHFKAKGFEAQQKTLFLTADVPDLTDHGLARRAEVHAFADAMRVVGAQS